MMYINLYPYDDHELDQTSQLFLISIQINITKMATMEKTIAIRLMPITLFLITLTTSCVQTRYVSYLNNSLDTVYSKGTNQEELAIQKNDILSIHISSLNQEASEIFNSTNSQQINNSSNTGNSVLGSGYLVNMDGSIELPMIGNVKAEGLSKNELKTEITNSIIERKLLVNPIVNIRRINFEVTVIGEVGKPTVITVPNEKISLLKALGLAGDITIYGKKENVLLIREVDGKKKVTHLNLNSSDFLNSPYYYLMPNDIVYVEPNKNKLASVGRGRQLVPSLLSGLSVILIVLNNII
jgi:polysaccharide export outer membrane protein